LTAEDRQFFQDIPQLSAIRQFFGRIACDANMTFQRIMESPRIAGDFAKAAKGPPIG
jgi:hypothetical protein